MEDGNRPSIEDTLIDIAFVVSKRGTCNRKQVGAVIADSKGVVLSTGYNGSLSGTEHCEHSDMDFDNRCTLAVHAEANAVYFAARNGVSVEGSTMYCTTAPCTKCAEAIVQSGIKKVVYSEDYRDEGIELIISVGVEVLKYE